MNKLITESHQLETFCNTLLNQDSSTTICSVDTEFISGQTYIPQLCLIQLAITRIKEKEIKKDNNNNTTTNTNTITKSCEIINDGVIDVSGEDINLRPLYSHILCNPNIIKIFHDGFQDLQILFHHRPINETPSNIFDTQVAASYCGYSLNVGYQTLVRHICNKDIDKTAQRTDWTQRPLRKNQIQYALCDVEYLGSIYIHLDSKLTSLKRKEWFNDEMNELINTLRIHPQEAWKRIKPPNRFNSMFLPVLKEIAEWREVEAQKCNSLRKHIVPDQVLIRIAEEEIIDEKTIERLLSRQNNRNNISNKTKYVHELISGVKKGLNMPADHCRALQPLKAQSLHSVNQPTVDLLKALLKLVAIRETICEQKIANVNQLKHIVADDTANVPALKTWRREIFGNLALELKHGHIALTNRESEGVKIIRLKNN